MGKFEIKQRTNGEFQFNLKASNGQVILTSEGYKSKSGCENGITSEQSNAMNEANYERKTSTDSKHYFNLKAANGQVIGTSQLYETEAARDKGIESVKSNGPNSTTE